MARPGGSHAGNVMPEMESTLVQRTTDTSTVGTHDAVLGAPAVQLGGGGSSRHIATRKIRDVESIYEELEQVDREVYEQALEDLVEVGLLVKEMDDDEDRTYYRTRDGLGWSEVGKIDCPTKKQVLLTLIDNPQTFFVLYNTQKGKLKIAAEEIRSWATTAGKKVVAFLVVDNEKTLADQSADGVMTIIDGVAKVFLLSSNSSETTLEGIRTHIDAYAADADGDYLMPVVVALNNAIQVKKVIALMTHIKTKMDARASPLRYGVVFDEADKVYPPIREKFKNLLVEDSRALHRLGFVTATEGDLMESDYEECANAYMYPVPVGHPGYRAIHTEETKVQVVVHRVKDSNDVYAETILANNRDYFATPITLKNGTQGFRKIIVNSGAKTESMCIFARNRVADGHYAMTVNMLGVWVYRPGHEKKRYSAKGKKFGQLLFSIYTELGLHDRPLFIIGRRKVDRGLGFHYAPRDGSDGLIWTDMILGRVDDKDTAVQKAGRLAGVVAQCPQYPGILTWWTDKKTADTIMHHNQIVDKVNTMHGCSALQAVRHAVDIKRGEEEAARRKKDEEEAEAAAKEEEAATAQPNQQHESVSHLEEFSTMEELCTRWAAILSAAGKPKQPTPRTPNYKEGTYVCSIGKTSQKQKAVDIRTKFPEGSSVANWGSGITTAAVGEHVSRVYAGYEPDDRVVFFLRWTIKEN